jgi:ubiquitin-conjugating enzyme E2 C
VYSVQTILLSLQSLLGGKPEFSDAGGYEMIHNIPISEPNNASPLNPDAARIWDKPEGR